MKVEVGSKPGVEVEGRQKVEVELEPGVEVDAEVEVPCWY